MSQTERSAAPSPVSSGDEEAEGKAVAKSAPLWKRILFSPAIAEKSAAKKIAYIGVMTAFCIASNLFEIKFATVQFSLTLLTSMLAGIAIGPLFGFCAVFLGDGLGYLVNSMGYPYYWWVALSCACMALVSGLVMHLPLHFRGAVFCKIALACILTLTVCSLGINTTGMYYIGLKIYMPKDVMQAFTERFGGRQTFWIYAAIRFFLMGQIWNSLVNYALLFAIVPALNAIRPLGLKIA